MWREEVRRAVVFSYPNKLTSTVFSRPRGPRVVPRWIHEPTVIAAIIGLAGTLLTVLITVWIATRGEPSPPRQADRLVVEIVPQSAKPSPPRQADPPEEKKDPRTLTLDDILDVLERHHQRATFGAVAGTLERDPRSLFNLYVRTPKTAWVVSKTTG